MAPRRQQAIAWKILKQKLATKMELRKRGIITETQDQRCPMCGKEDESVKHLFFGCDYATNIWQEIYRWLGICMVPHWNPEIHIEQHSLMVDNKKFVECGVAMWVAAVVTNWKDRNALIFEGVQPKF
ncbi:hypothetical protein ACS0TY_031075 [Phlomoides rotata]